MNDTPAKESEQSPDSHPATRKRRRRFRKTRWTIGLVLLVGILFFAAHWLYLPMGTGPAGPTADRQMFEKIWSDRPVLLLGLGDSITEGFGVPERLSYFQRLVENTVEDPADIQGIHLFRVLPNLTSMNLSRSGSTSLHHAEMQIPAIPMQDENTFGIVVMTTGGNDIIHNYGRSPPKEGAMFGATLEEAQPWIENFETRLNSMLDEVNTRFPGGCEIFLANIYDPTDTRGAAKLLGFASWPDVLKVHAAYNEIITRIAEERPNVHLVDIYTPFLGHGLDCRKFWRKHYQSSDPHFWYLLILEDPNDRGYDAIRRLFLNEIAKVVPSTLSSTATPAEVE